MYDLIIIGGGASGVFAAIAAKTSFPDRKIALLEKSAVLLSKVKISGGGRCNVTHNCMDPKILCQNYPRGSKELLGPFHRFGPKETIQWFASKGVLLKAEGDGRMFPLTDVSETIIQCLVTELKNLGVEILFRHSIQSIEKKENDFELTLSTKTITSKKIMLATGSGKDGYLFAKNLGHTIQEPIPSLFTFNIPNFPLKELSGISVPNIQIKAGSLSQTGPILITHFGFSGPAVLKLSAWGARLFYEQNYKSQVTINWVFPSTEQEIYNLLCQMKNQFPQKTLSSIQPFDLPKNLWKFFIEEFSSKRLHDLSLAKLRELSAKLCKDSYQIDGKTTNKEEFVTCGGITLKEIDFKTMESKICPGLYFGGEILDIDGITGGFNFQNAWTTGFIAGSSAFHEN